MREMAGEMMNMVTKPVQAGHEKNAHKYIRNRLKYQRHSCKEIRETSILRKKDAAIFPERSASQAEGNIGASPEYAFLFSHKGTGGHYRGCHDRYDEKQYWHYVVEDHG